MLRSRSSFAATRSMSSARPGRPRGGLLALRPPLARDGRYCWSRAAMGSARPGGDVASGLIVVDAEGGAGLVIGDAR